LAEQRGLPYQTYIKMLLRDGLRRDFASQKKARR
jgi:predicted DNA binding CopG/RHH family protein